MKEKEIQIIIKNNYEPKNGIYIGKNKNIEPLKNDQKLNILENINNNNNFNISNDLLKNIENKDEFQKFLDIGLDKNINFNLIDSIFSNENINHKFLSSTGNEIDIPALILYLINPISEPEFYWEDKKEIISNFSLSIIIDNSISCLNEFSIEHTILTIKILLNAFSKCDIPNFDLIVTAQKNPKILCSKINTYKSFDKNNKLWKSFFLLKNPLKSVDLAFVFKSGI